MSQSWMPHSGGWRLTVHETGFTYDGEARGSYNEARLTPLTLADPVGSGLGAPSSTDRRSLELSRLLGQPRSSPSSSMSLTGRSR